MMKSKVVFPTIATSIAILFCVLAAFFYPREPKIEEFPVIKKAPDFELTNQHNEKVRLSQFRGKTKVLSFIYVSCCIPNACPRTIKNFTRLQESLGDDLSNKVVFLSVTFDPERDTQGALKKYAELHEADFSNWHFLTGSRETIDKVCEDYVIIHEDQEDGLIRHSVVTFLIDEKDDVRKMYFANEWKPEEIREDIITILGQEK